MDDICGWKAVHRDVLRYESSGNVRLTVKIQIYADYSQEVKFLRVPGNFRIIGKELNRFLLFRGIVGKRGSIKMDREFEIYPAPSTTLEDWGNIGKIPEVMKRKYHVHTKLWPVNSPVLREIKEMEWFHEDDLHTWVRSAAEFLRGRLKYIEPLNQRLGAEKAYVSRMGDCDEFTDLFITIARMRGIPARRITGYYIHARQEPHAWSEVYSPVGEWIPVDVALMRIGEHSPRHVILKVEEFNPSIEEYRLQWKGGKLDYDIVREEEFSPIPC